MNLETKITIYKFTPQVFTLTHYFSLICNILRIKKACMVSYFCPTKKL